MGSRRQGFNKLLTASNGNLISSYSSYLNGNSLLEFLCDCGEKFVNKSRRYIAYENARKCLKCKSRYAVNSIASKQQWLQDCINIHGKYYDYSKVPDVFKATDKVCIICPKHGDIFIQAHMHKKQSGCNHCGIDKATSVTRSNIEDFIFKANKVHQYRYSYENVNYSNAITKVDITCNKHGPFLQTPDYHLRRGGCPKCVKLTIPIREICDTLDHHGIVYTVEKTFDNCISDLNHPLFFDIFIPNKNLCIEYDGIHHYRPGVYHTDKDSGNTAFNRIQQNDKIKNNFCYENNIDLIRIPYTDKHPGASVSKYILQLEDRQYIYEWDMFQSNIQEVITYIKSFKYNKFAIYGITRGGLIPMTCITCHFNSLCEYGIADFQRYDGNSNVVSFQKLHRTKDLPIFIIDDLVSSGITMKRVIKKIQFKFKMAKIHPIVLFGAPNTDNIHYINDHPGQWIQLPWEL